MAHGQTPFQSLHPPYPRRCTPPIQISRGATKRKQMNATEEESCFERLPDALLLLIFNKLSDAKSLTLCLSVSKRFASVIPQTGTISLSIPSHKHSPKSSRESLPLSLLRILFSKLIAKPFRFLHHIVVPKSTIESDNISYYSTNEVLKHFKEVKSMQIELPSDGNEVELQDSDSLLKWKAEFGSELECCVVLGATSFQRSATVPDKLCETNAQVLDDEELQLRIVWTISCLIAASARHYLLKQILTEHDKVENVVASDVNKQGKLYMGKEKIAELRNSMKSLGAVETSMERTRLPDLSMKLWHAPMLELAETGYSMRGATLIVITSVDGVVGKGSDGSWFGCDGEDCEGKVFNEAVREMMKVKRCYAMTMNAF